LYNEANQKTFDMVENCRNGSYFLGLDPDADNIFNSITEQVSEGSIDLEQLKYEVGRMKQNVSGMRGTWEESSKTQKEMATIIPSRTYINNSLTSLANLLKQNNSANCGRFRENSRNIMNKIETILSGFLYQENSDVIFNSIQKDLQVSKSFCFVKIIVNILLI
jgi:hypothetical protein